MRQIKFRGKRKDNGEWIYGFVVNNLWGYYIIHHYSIENGEIHSCIQAEVIPESVGQFTGKEDKNGKSIYEGDWLGHVHNVVEFLNGSFCINGDRPLSIMASSCGIVGNIHEPI